MSPRFSVNRLYGLVSRATRKRLGRTRWRQVLLLGPGSPGTPCERKASLWPHRRCLQIISPLRRTIILRSFPSNRPRNSISWNILQGTSLFSRFYSATLPVNSRKQGICLKNTGGGRWETTNLMRANSEQLAPPQVVGVPDVPALPSYQDQWIAMPISGSQRVGLLLFPLPRAYHGQSENLRMG
jgi:hypothetical protein